MGTGTGERSRRIPMLDAVRFAALCAVATQHAVFLSASSGVKASLAVLGCSICAIPLLFATSGYLSTLGGRSVELRRRVRRILVPYAVWSVVLFGYGMQSEARSGTLGTVLSSVSLTGVVLAGQAFYTLWFLAMLVYLTMLGWAVRNDRGRVFGAIAALAVYAAISILRATQPIMDTDTWGGFLIIAPLCVCSYFAGAALHKAPRVRSPAITLAALILAVAADAALYVLWGTELTQIQQFAILTIGTVAALLGLWTVAHSTRADVLIRLAAIAGTFTLGIYTIHAPVLNVLRRLTGTRESTDLVWALVLAVIATLVSLGASYLMSRVRVLRPLVR